MEALQRTTLALAILGATFSASPSAAQPHDPEPPFVVCDDQRYALCATAECFVYNQVAYCACDVLKGDSISEQLSFDSPIGERNVCSVMTQGRFNGYMVSTYSFPGNVGEGGNTAVYSCPGEANADGGVAAPVAYAQCDGGICFNSTIARYFPGFPERLQANEIICSCPIATAASPGSSNPNGFQISGPYFPDAPQGERCDPAACAQCSVANPTANGATLRVGAAAGVPNFLTLRLYGPPLPGSNQCQCKCTDAPNGTTSCTVAEGS
jgi:hypothetical protein